MQAASFVSPVARLRLDVVRSVNFRRLDVPTVSAVRELHDAEFDDAVLKAPGPVLVDFYRSSCGPCRHPSPDCPPYALSEFG
eukprot:tig00000792_g4186.t1